MPTLRFTSMNTHSTQTQEGNKTYHETLPQHTITRGGGVSDKFTKLPGVIPRPQA